MKDEALNFYSQAAAQFRYFKDGWRVRVSARLMRSPKQYACWSTQGIFSKALHPYLSSECGLVIL
jgi:hypothetical protein